MQFSDFPEANRSLTAPVGLEAEIGTLRVYDDGNQSISCWLPSQAEREAIAAGLPVWVGVQAGQTQPPVWVCGLKPYMPPVVHKPSEQMLRALAYIAGLLPDPTTVAAGLRDGAGLASEQPELRGPNGEPMEAGKTYYIGGRAIAYAHCVALREAYQLNGQAGVVAYLQPYEAFLPKEIFTV